MSVGTSMAIPASMPDAHMAIGAIDRAGGQWGGDWSSGDAYSPTVASRTFKSDSTIYWYDPTGTVLWRGLFSSMDASGFSLNFTKSVGAIHMSSFALAGVRAQASCFAKTTGAAPSLQSVTGVGFRPGVVLFVSMQDVAMAAAGQTHLRFGLGASDGTTQGSSAIYETNAVTTSSAGAIDKTDKAFVKMNNATRVIDAEAILKTLDPDGFTLQFTTDDAVATQICYLALGSF
jgi:hypothetical protein